MPVVNNNKTKTASGDDLGGQEFMGTDGSNYLIAASIEATADAQATDGAVPGKLSLKTANSSGALTEALTVDSGQKVTSPSPTGGIGYGTGAGGTVTQATNKSTGVTLNKVTGQITMNNASLASNTSVAFTLTNSVIAATDFVAVNHVSGGTAGSYTVTSTPAAGSAVITVRNITGAPLAEAIVLQFAVIKAVTA